MRPRIRPLFSLLDLALRVAERRRPDLHPLEPDALAAAAVRRTGLSDFGHPYHRGGLLTLAAASNTLPGNAYGRMLMRLALAQLLENRLYLVAQIPRLSRLPLRSPLVVTGLPRTGTTFLHRLLAADPAHHAPPYWQLAFPLPRGADDTAARRRRAAQEQLRPRHWFTPELDGIHYIRVDEPEECMFMLGLTFESFLFWVLQPVEDYLDWYLAQDHREKYREYALLLRALQEQASSRRLALKAPAHVDALAALIEAVPDAMVVQTHRDPVQTCASWCSVNFQTQRLAVGHLDPRRSGARNARLLEQMIAGNLAAREQIGERILDIRYHDLTIDPLGTVRRIYRRFGLPLSEEAVAAMTRYLDENPQGRHGDHRYQLEDFGLDPGDVARRFADYRERFLAPRSAA